MQSLKMVLTASHCCFIYIEMWLMEELLSGIVVK